MAENLMNKYLSFRIGNEFYAIDIKHVKEIVIMTMDITEMPETAEYFRGVINLRGKIIPVIDVRCRFRMEPITYDEKTCIVVLNVDGTETGFIVERVAEVLDIADNQISPAPKIGRKEDSRYIRGIGKVGDHVKIVLDVDKLLRDEDLEDIKEIVNS